MVRRIQRARTRRERRGSRRRSRLHLAAACSAGLAVPVAAAATTFIETDPLVFPFIDRFGNSFSDRTLLPDGTTELLGQVYYGETDVFDSADYVVFGDLVPEVPFTLTYDMSSDCPTAPRILDEEGSLLQPVRDIRYERGPWVFTGSVPTSGALVLGMHLCQDRMNYQVALDVARVPEPSTALLTGAALVASASYLRRRAWR